MRHIIVVVLAGMFLLVQPSLGLADGQEGPDDSFHWIVFTSTNGQLHEKRALKCVDLIGVPIINGEPYLDKDAYKAYAASFMRHEGWEASYHQIIEADGRLKFCAQPLPLFEFKAIEVPASDFGEIS